MVSRTEILYVVWSKLIFGDEELFKKKYLEMKQRLKIYFSFLMWLWILSLQKKMPLQPFLLPVVWIWIFVSYTFPNHFSFFSLEFFFLWGPVNWHTRKYSKSFGSHATIISHTQQVDCWRCLQLTEYSSKFLRGSIKVSRRSSCLTKQTVLVSTRSNCMRILLSTRPANFN